MKYTFVQALLCCLTLGLGLVTEATAQTDKEKKTTIRVKVVEKKDGKTRIVERNYEIDPLSDTDQKVFVDKVLDSLGVNSGGQKQVSIIVSDGDNENTIVQDRQRIEIRDKNDMKNEPRVWSWNDDTHVFKFDTDELKENMRRFEKEFRPKMEIMRKDFEHFGDRLGTVWENDVMQNSSVRGLTVYANNPDNGTLNLHFSVPEKGDVTVTVTDTQGKEVGQKVIRDFSGEFMGQVELKKNTKGTLFVTVVQNGDGTVRRIVIK